MLRFQLSFSTGCRKWNTTALTTVPLFIAGLFIGFLVEKCAACPNNRNLRSGPILALGLIQTLKSLWSLRPDFGRNADWLLEQCHKIWVDVGINGSWKRLFLTWLFSQMISRRRREGSILLSFFIVLWSYSRKICLNMCHGNPENSDGCSYLLRICFISLACVSSETHNLRRVFRPGVGAGGGGG